MKVSWELALKVKSLLLPILFLSILFFNPSTLQSSTDHKNFIDKNLQEDINNLSQSLSLLTYELQVEQIKLVLELYLKNNPSFYAFQLFDIIDREYLVSTYKDNEIIYLKGQDFPDNFIKPRNSLTTNIYYLGSKIAELTIFIDVPLDLNQEELEFLVNNHKLKANIFNSYKPYSFIENGIVKGYNNDMIRLIAQKLNIELDFQEPSSLAEAIEDIKRDRIDIILPFAKSKDREKNFLFSQKEIIEVNHSFASLNGEIYNFEDLENKTIALPKNYVFKNTIKNQYPNIEIKSYDNLSLAMSAVINKEADAVHCYSDLIQKVIDSNIIFQDVVLQKTSRLSSSKLYFGFNKNSGPLKSLIDKAYKSIDELKILKLQMSWLKVTTFQTNKLLKTIYNEKEIDYINKKDFINVCTLPDYLPYSKITPNGEFIGTIGEFIKKVKETSGLNIELIPTSSWKETHKYIQTGKCDFIPFLLETEKRKEYLNFTDTYMKIPLVIATNKKELFIDSLNDVIDKEFAMIGSYATQQYVTKKFPNIKINRVRKTEEGLEKVINGEVYGFISTLPNIAYIMQRDNIIDIKIAGKIGIENHMKMATRADEPILKSIIQKAILTVNKFEKEKILHKWVSIKYDKGFDYDLFWKIITIFSIVFVMIILILVIFWNRKLKKLNAKLEILSRTDRLTGLYNRIKIDDIFRQEIDRAKRYNTSLSLIMVDIDLFKNINDTFGHNIGDMVLTKFSHTLLSKTRKTDYIGRWGGEEFIIICTETRLKGAVKQAELLRKAITKIECGINYKLSASFGVTQYNPDLNIEEFIKNADDALYEAKHAGRNCVISN